MRPVQRLRRRRPQRHGRPAKLAVNTLSATGSTNTLYLPAGTYLISRTLFFVGTDVNLIGADPTTVTIKYDGPSGGTMLSSAAAPPIWSGLEDAAIQRITFNGNNLADTGVFLGTPVRCRALHSQRPNHRRRLREHGRWHPRRQPDNFVYQHAA